MHGSLIGCTVHESHPVISCHMLPKLVRTASTAFAVVAFTSACTNPTTSGQPSITLTEVRQAAEGGSERLAPIAGRVSGARPGQRVVQRDGRWTRAEVKLSRSLGYGTVRDTSHLDPAAALGFLTWDELGPEQNHRELDVEVSRWGNVENKDVQYVVQPHYVAANVYRFNQPAGQLTRSFRWEPDRTLFQTVRPDGTS
jgi:hypothetical protein